MTAIYGLGPRLRAGSQEKRSSCFFSIEPSKEQSDMEETFSRTILEASSLKKEYRQSGESIKVLNGIDFKIEEPFLWQPMQSASPTGPDILI